MEVIYGIYTGCKHICGNCIFTGIVKFFFALRTAAAPLYIGYLSGGTAVKGEGWKNAL